MGMGWRTLSQPYTELDHKDRCMCGKGYIYFYNVVEEESEFPPFERGYSYRKRTCVKHVPKNLMLINSHQIKPRRIRCNSRFCF